MIELDDAWELILANTDRLGTEKRLIENSICYVLANDIVSPIDISPFRNSAMDGFAVKAEWLTECTADQPESLPIDSTVFAGDAGTPCVLDRKAVKIMTGAGVPEGFDAVVPFEDTKYTPDEVCFFKPTTPGRHVRQPGEDITRGQQLFDAGATIGRLDVGILAAVGLRSVLTYRKPSIKIAGLGNELTDPGERLADGHIYDSNTFTIGSLVTPFGEQVERVSCVPDSEEEILKVLDSPHDVIVTSGGVSMGERDLVIDMAESCGWQRVFHKVRIKPGKPLYVAVRGKQMLFGLPGNPLSVAVTCSVFLLPALKKMAGFTDYRLRPQPAIMSADMVRRSRRTLIWPGFIREVDGRAMARFSPKKSSAALTALQGTDGLIIQNATDENSGDMEVGALPWFQILGC